MRVYITFLVYYIPSAICCIHKCTCVLANENPGESHGAFTCTWLPPVLLQYYYLVASIYQGSLVPRPPQALIAALEAMKHNWKCLIVVFCKISLSVSVCVLACTCAWVCVCCSRLPLTLIVCVVSSSSPLAIVRPVHITRPPQAFNGGFTLTSLTSKLVALTQWVSYQYIYPPAVLIKAYLGSLKRRRGFLIE